MYSCAWKHEVVRSPLRGHDGEHGKLGQALAGRVGLSWERISAVARALGAAVVVEATSEARPVKLGTIDETGRFMTDLHHLTLPGVVDVRASFGPVRPGDEVHVKAADAFEMARWMLVERESGVRMVARCDEREGVRVLVDVHGDAVLYEPARHRIIARIYARTECL